MKYPVRAKHKIGSLYKLIHAFSGQQDLMFNSVENIKDVYSGDKFLTSNKTHGGKYFCTFSEYDPNKDICISKFIAEEISIGKIVLFLGYVSEIIYYAGYPARIQKANVCKIVYGNKVKFINKVNLGCHPCKLTNIKEDIKTNVVSV